MGKVNIKNTYSLQNIFYHKETFLLKNEACVEEKIPSRASLGGHEPAMLVNHLQYHLMSLP